MQSGSESSGQKGPSFIEQARRAQIVEAASEAVAEFGYARTSLARIAEQADISKGVITYHFSGKDEILREVVTRFFEQGWEYMEPRIRAERTATGQVRAWVRSELEFFGGRRTDFLAMSDIVSNHRGEDGSHAFTGEFTEEIEGLAELLARGQDDGELRAFDTRSVARIILRCSESVLHAWALDPAVDLTTQSAELLDFIDHAIRRETT